MPKKSKKTPQVPPKTLPDLATAPPKSLLYHQFLKLLILALPSLLFFSYYPIISLGSSDSMNFELSLPLLWLPLFFLATLLYFPKALRNFKPATLLLAAALPLYATVSILWSANPTRAFLTAGIYWLIVYAIFMLIYLIKKFYSPQFFKVFWRTFFASSLLICIFCWLQCLLDIAGVDRSVTLLCEGCSYSMFGFPHPSGFAIEPQFMGNLLLAPTLAALYFLVFRQTKHRRALIVLTFIFVATLFLTFSRGAIYAFATALIILLIFAIKNHRFRPSLFIIPVCAFLFTLICQGVFATLSPTSDNFLTATTKSIHQLSLGIIDLRPAEVKIPASTTKTVTSPTDATGDTTKNSTTDTETGIETETTPETSVFSGYVPGSTNTRLSLASGALTVWTQTPQSFLFGTGLGSAGAVLYQNGLTSSPKEIVQNEYASILLELGAVGLILAVALIFFIYYQFCRNQQPPNRPQKVASQRATMPSQHQTYVPLLIPLFTAYLITLCFFSGPTNALQIYLIPPLLFAVLQPTFSGSTSAKLPARQP